MKKKFSTQHNSKKLRKIYSKSKQTKQTELKKVVAAQRFGFSSHILSLIRTYYKRE